MLHYRSPQPWMTVVLPSLLGSYVSMILWLAGYKLTDASIASVLNETAGAFIVLFAWLFLKEENEFQAVEWGDAGVCRGWSCCVCLIGLVGFFGFFGRMVVQVRMNCRGWPGTMPVSRPSR